MKTLDFPLVSDWPDCGYDVAGIIIFDRQGRIAMQLRDNLEGLSGAGKWSFFGGHVEEGENWQETVARELEEETGISEPPSLFRPVLRLVPPNGLQAHHYYFQLDRPVEVPEINVHEGAGFAFWELDQAPTDNMVDSAQMVLKYIREQN